MRWANLAIAMALILSLAGTAGAQAQAKKKPGKKDNPPAAQARQAAPVAPSAGAPAWLYPPAAVTEAAAGLTRKTKPNLVVEQLGPIFVDGAGERIAARRGDWRLANERISLTFANVNTEPTTNSHPLGGWRSADAAADQRHPGALIDIATAESPDDVLAFFTQSVGTDMDGALVNYDTAEPVEQGDELGLRLEGSPFLNAPLRLETVYWLKAGEKFARIESRLLNLPAGVRPAAFTDVSEWVGAEIFAQEKGFAAGTRINSFAVPGVQIGGAGRVVRIEPESGYLLGELVGNADGRSLGQARGRIRSLWAGQPIASRPTTITLEAGMKPEGPRAFLLDRAWLAAAETSPTLPASGHWTRRLWIATGNQDHMRTLAQQLAGIPTGKIMGRVLDPITSQPIPRAEVHLLHRTQPGKNEEIPPPFTIGNADDSGHYEFEVPPGRYFVKPVTRYNFSTYETNVSVDVKAGGVVTTDKVRRPIAQVRVRVVDAETSELLPARILLQEANGVSVRIGGTPSAHGYLNRAYIPAESVLLELPEKPMVMRAAHGTRYFPEEIDTTPQVGTPRELTIGLSRMIPAEWTGFLPGLRTSATPGVSLTADDIVLMAAAEGVQWVTSGDFDVITDLTPAIQKQGLEKHIGASLGFRTAVPRHPEWGQFLIYPLARNAPDPATARSAWSRAATRGELIKALRKAYPGALIQAELPWVEEGEGFLGFGIKNPFVAAAEPFKGEDLSVDAVNWYPPDRPWVSNNQNNFFMFNLLQSRVYLFSTAHAGRSLEDGQPGLPLLLVHTGARGLPAEQRLFERLKAKQYELSSGPFIDFSVDGKRGGELIKNDPTLGWKLKVVAPAWANSNEVSIDKEAANQVKYILNLPPGATQIIPGEGEGDFLEQTLKDLKILTFKDTLLSAQSYGGGTSTGFLRGDGSGPKVPACAVTWPLRIDGNNDGKFKPSDMIERGR